MSRDSGVVPDDCSRLLPVDELVALLGLPLDSIVVRTTIGVPAPSVGRTERLTCSYTARTGGPRQRQARARRSTRPPTPTPDAAHAQWRPNAAVEDGPHRDHRSATPTVCSSSGPTEAVLLVAERLGDR